MRLAIFLISISTAFAQTEFLKPDGLAPANGYTHVVKTGPGTLVYISGQVPLNSKGELVGKDDLQAQTEQVFANLRTALASAGATFDQVIKINWYVKGFKPESLGVLRQVRNKYVNIKNPPASTLVGVASLFREDCLLEVEAVAVIPDKRDKK
jgi:enamine deaminase RidA (YjgF/YER057c/UK114 family)